MISERLLLCKLYILLYGDGVRCENRCSCLDAVEIYVYDRDPNFVLFFFFSQTGITVLLLHFFSLLFHDSSIFTISVHWNVSEHVTVNTS